MLYKSIRLVPVKQNSEDLTESDLAKAPDGFFVEINVIDVLEMSPNKSALNDICNKIRKGGKVVLNGVDGLDMCRKVYYGQVSLQSASSQFFGPVNNLNSIVELKDYFLKKQWSLKFAGLQNGRYLIEAVRV